MPDKDKQIFLSYRRTNQPWALAIDQYLRAKGYDVFLDISSIPSGDFERIILGQIAARPHFLVLLTPNSLERCREPGDWLRKEIETALKLKRNIVPIFLEGFSFDAVEKHLTGDLALIQKYNGLELPARFFQYAMEDLCKRYLSVSLDAVIHPTPPEDIQEVIKVQAQVASQSAPTIAELSTTEWNERGLNARSLRDSLRFFSEAISLSPDYADAYFNRGQIYVAMGDSEKALKDFNQVIDLNPKDSVAYIWRGLVNLSISGHLDKDDFERAIILDPNNCELLDMIIDVYSEEDSEGALEYLERRIALVPDSLSYNNRAFIRFKKGDLTRAIEDAHRAIELDTNSSQAYDTRGMIFHALEDYQNALRDFDKAITLLELGNSSDDSAWQRIRMFLQKGHGILSLRNEHIIVGPSDSSAHIFYFNRGNVYFDMSNFDKAISDYDRAILIYPNYAAAYCNRGTAYENLGNYRAAIRDYQKHVNLGGREALNAKEWIKELKRHL
jgi:tetratricopeptide (TPR) repeat protein